jgi:hypothetical protein
MAVLLTNVDILTLVQRGYELVINSDIRARVERPLSLYVTYRYDSMVCHYGA